MLHHVAAHLSLVVATNAFMLEDALVEELDENYSEINQRMLQHVRSGAVERHEAKGTRADGRSGVLDTPRANSKVPWVCSHSLAGVEHQVARDDTRLHRGTKNQITPRASEERRLASLCGVGSE